MGMNPADDMDDEETDQNQKPHFGGGGGDKLLEAIWNENVKL